MFFVGDSNAQGQLGNGVSADNPPDQSYPVYVHESESSANHLTGIVQVRAGGKVIPALLLNGAWILLGTGKLWSTWKQ